MPPTNSFLQAEIHISRKHNIGAFRDIPRDKLEEEQIAFNEGYWGTTGIEWPELLKSDRVLIISEAGAGKTFECQQQEQEIWDAGGAPFFLELAQLAKRNLQDMLAPHQKARFNAWLGGQIEKATFFLDSIDELKLTQGSFKQALTSLANAIDGQFSRARIVVTSRPVAIDQEMFTKILPMPPKEDDDSAPAELLAKAAMGRHKKAATSKEMSTRTVALLPLTDEQIRELAASKGVTNPDDMLADIKRRHAKEFARRPEDLIELCQDWRTENRIRAHLDQVRTNVRVKLTPAERENAKLSPERAAEGASRLALAALLTRRFTLKHSSIADHEGGGESALDPARILTDWSDAERAELLERPLFGFASYGRVRFHPRSVIEYLAAKRLRTLLDKGMSIKAVKRILFATTAQGHAIVKRPRACNCQAINATHCRVAGSEPYTNLRRNPRARTRCPSDLWRPRVTSPYTARRRASGNCPQIRKRRLSQLAFADRANTKTCFVGT
jgi:hypothetical protein